MADILMLAALVASFAAAAGYVVACGLLVRPFGGIANRAP